MEDVKEKYICWSEDCVWQPVGAVMAVLKTSESGPSTEDRSPRVTLNETGRAIWELCDGTRTLDTIFDQLLEEYEGDPEQIRENVRKTISALKEQNFLKYGETPRKHDILEVPSHKYLVWDDDVIWNEVENHVVAMNNQTGLVFPVPDEAKEMWKLCDGKKTVSEILSILREKEVITEKMPAVEFKLLLKQLVKLGFLSLRNEPT